MVDLLLYQEPLPFEEDLTSSLAAVLATAPAFDIAYTVTLSEGLCWADGSTLPKTFSFTTTNWFTTQTITFKAINDLMIEGQVASPIWISTSSADPIFIGLSSELSVSVIDNDFQRSLEPEKLPNEGNNYIRYDVAGDASLTSSGDCNLGAGNDILEVSAATSDPFHALIFKSCNASQRTQNAKYGVVQ